MSSSPCLHCPDRTPGTKDHPGCHATCEKYIAYWNGRQAENADKLKKMKSFDLTIDGVRKARKYQRAQHITKRR